jgi:hypothetical protein
MVLSKGGDHPMTKLSDTQLVILRTASQREDYTILPLTIDLKGGALQKVLASLERKGLIAPMGEPRGDDPPPLRITRAGLEAIGVAPEDEEEAPGEASFVEVTDAPQGGTEAPEPARTDQEAEDPRPAPAAAPAAKTCTPRQGTKQAQMIELLRRPQGATVEQIADATGWQKHTIRGAISGALKRKLGLTVTSDKREDRERVYRIAGPGQAIG